MSDREKILEVIQDVETKAEKLDMTPTERNQAIAEALIFAGFGDVAEYRRTLERSRKAFRIATADFNCTSIYFGNDKTDYKKTIEFCNARDCIECIENYYLSKGRQTTEIANEIGIRRTL